MTKMERYASVTPPIIKGVSEKMSAEVEKYSKPLNRVNLSTALHRFYVR